MKSIKVLKIIGFSLWLSSIIFFVLALYYPILYSEILMGLNIEQIYFFDSINFFFEEGEYGLGMIILLFSFVFPIVKYIFIGLKIFNLIPFQNKILSLALELLSKWAMLDVFVIALLIINMKFTSLLVNTKLNSGTNYFATSIILMILCSALLPYFTDKRSLN